MQHVAVLAFISVFAVVSGAVLVGVSMTIQAFMGKVLR